MLGRFVALARGLGRQEGQGLVEYALIIALIAVAAIVVMGTMGTEIAAKFQEIVTQLSS